LPADRCPEHIDRLALCHHCQGLTVTRMTRLDGVADVRMEGPAGSISLGPVTAVYLGPVEPCPNVPALEEGAATDV
jgi:hypothetical protein